MAKLRGSAPRSSLRDVGDDPDYRFTLANERTFLAWIRTCLALLAAGVAVIKFIPQFGVPGGQLALGVLLILLALVLAPSSYVHWRRNERAMRQRTSLPESTVPPLLAAGLAVVALLSLILLVAEMWP